MPRESVYGSELPYGEDEPARSIVEITWSREAGHVQITTKCVHAEDGSDYYPPLEPIEVATDGEVGALLAEGLRSGHYVQLGRREINTLIRNLRRARDQAFGRDE